MMAIQIGQPSVTPKIAIIMSEKPIIEPTERSNSPAIIKRQAPTAMIMNCAETTLQFITPWELNMPLSPAKMKKRTKTMMVPQMPPNSGRIRAWRMRDCCLTRSSTPEVFASDMESSTS